MVLEVPGVALSFLNSICQYLLLNKQFKEKCVYTAVHLWQERQMSVPCDPEYGKLIAANELDF